MSAVCVSAVMWVGRIICLVSLARALQDDVPFARAFDLVQEYMQERFMIPTWRSVVVLAVWRSAVGKICAPTQCGWYRRHTHLSRTGVSFCSPLLEFATWAMCGRCLLGVNRFERAWAKLPGLGALLCGRRYRRVVHQVDILNAFAAVSATTVR